MSILFFSYSHRDEQLRDELQTHLAPLQREGLIESWHDRRISAGDELDHAISRNLEDADIILLLVSPYFLASDYCYDMEMARAMERHHAGTARVIPIILQPCDWQSAPFGKLMAVPKDGKPITKFPNLHDGFLEVAQAIRAIVQSSGRASPAAPKIQTNTPNQPGGATTALRSSNLRVKKQFTDHDRDNFREEGFEYIATLFEGSLRELETRNPDISTRFRRIDGNRFTAMIYRGGKCVSQCSVALGDMFGQSITYSSDANATNSMNDGLNIVDDGTTLSFTSFGMSSFGNAQRKQLTLQGAAESFWSHLIRPLQQ